MRILSPRMREIACSLEDQICHSIHKYCPNNVEKFRLPAKLIRIKEFDEEFLL